MAYIYYIFILPFDSTIDNRLLCYFPCISIYCGKTFKGPCIILTLMKVVILYLTTNKILVYAVYNASFKTNVVSNVFRHC